MVRYQPVKGTCPSCFSYPPNLRHSQIWVSCFQKHYWHHINHHLCRISEKFSCPTFKCLCMLGQSRQTNMRCCQLQSTVSPEDDGQMSLVLSNLKKVDIDGCITSSRICNLRNTKEAQQSLWKVGGVKAVLRPAGLTLCWWWWAFHWKQDACAQNTWQGFPSTITVQPAYMTSSY